MIYSKHLSNDELKKKINLYNVENFAAYFRLLFKKITKKYFIFSCYAHYTNYPR